MRLLQALIIFFVICILHLTVAVSFSTAKSPFEFPPKGGLPECAENLNICNFDLDECYVDLAECEANPGQTFPGDGFSNPDAYGLSGHGVALSFTDNGDGTFTDNNTGYMWEKKDDNGGLHDKDNVYKWSATLPNPDGTLFTEFLDAINNNCDGDGTTPCNTDADCSGIGSGLCGLAGYRDWCIPNIRVFQSLGDFSLQGNQISFPGLSSTDHIHWTSTPHPNLSTHTWSCRGNSVHCGHAHKTNENFVGARAVRPCN